MTQAPAAAEACAAPADEAGPQRTCVLTRVAGQPETMLRLALAPDGRVVPDLAARLSGRGAWIAPDRAGLAQALAKGRLKAQLARAFHAEAGTLDVPADLVAHIDALLARRALDRLGLENRAGHLTFGFDRLIEAIERGRVRGLIHAGDAAADGCAKLDAALRRAGSAAWSQVIPAGRAELSLALGRANVVHAAVLEPGAAHRIERELERWRAFAGTGGLEHAA